MPYASPYPPPGGGFTFINPTVNGKPYEYTLAEAFDFINDMLILKTKHILIRTNTMITMFPADVDVPESVIPLIHMDELPERGRTEIVKIVIRLKNHEAEDVAGKVKSLLGDLGKVTALPGSNDLIMQAPRGEYPQYAQDIRPHRGRRFAGTHVYASVRFHPRRSRPAPSCWSRSACARRRRRSADAERDVEQDDVERALRRGVQRRLAVSDRGHVVPLAFEGTRQHLPQRAVVVDQQNVQSTTRLHVSRG